MRWPQTIDVFSRMRTDSKIDGLMKAVTYPILRGTFQLDKNGANEEAVKLLSEDLGLEIEGEESENIRARLPQDGEHPFDHFEFLEQSLENGLTYGHMYWEIVGEIKDEKFRLKKLAPRDPDTIKKFGINSKTGQLRYIEQQLPTGLVRIPSNRLLPFVWNKKAGLWTGRSALRTLYREWLLKDALLRIDATNHGRAGGVPVVEAHKGATDKEIQELSKLAQSFRVGEEAGAALPHGANLRTMGAVSIGANPTLQSIRYLDQMMSEAFLAMFMDLASNTHGSRALGESLIDWFQIAQEMVADWYAKTLNKLLIPQWMMWNYGDSIEFLPMISYTIGDDPEITVEAYNVLTESGSIKVDKGIRDFWRERFKLPDEEDSEEVPPTGPGVPHPSFPPQSLQSSISIDKDFMKSVIAAQASLPEDRKLRRQPTAFELEAQIDYAGIESFYVSERDKLLEQWLEDVRPGQLLEAEELIIAADGNLETLADIEVGESEDGEELLIAAALLAVAEGSRQAIAEAKAQDVSLRVPQLDDAIRVVQTRAKALNILLANFINTQISELAGALSGGGLLPDTVGELVRKELVRQGAASIRDQLGRLVQQGTSLGRMSALQGKPDDVNVKYIATELLDANTCGPCKTIDGKEYNTLEESLEDYPSGQYRSCDGGPRCRGFVFAVYDG